MDLSRLNKRIISICTDFVGLLLIAILAIWLRFGDVVFPVTEYAYAIAIFPLIAIPVFIRLGLYRAVIRYISYRFVFVVFWAVSLTFLLWSTAIFLIDLSFPRSALIIAWVMALLFVLGSRLMVRAVLTGVSKNSKEASSVIIYGAGESGRQLMKAMEIIPSKKLVAFVDDDEKIVKQQIGSTKIYSSRELESLIQNHNVSEVLLAIPSISFSARKKIIEQLESLPVKILTLPPIDEIVNGKVLFSDIREVSIEDLLGREFVLPRQNLLEKNIINQVVMVSGAGGSIGSELCRQVVKQKPSKLILFERNEFSLYQIEKELKDFDVEIISILGSVSNKKKLAHVFNQYKVNTVYHAAAYKHVPLVEHNIEEGIVNNSFGTLNIAKTSAECGVNNFVLISTDKAVRPTNFMGASKRLAEMSLQALQPEYTKTSFSMVRFGNVLGSSGSVIPLFKKQIATGGPLTVTHKEMTRYFMTIPEASSLVIQAGAMGGGGAVFVLDMGKPVKIVDLAKKMIHLSGFEVMDEINKNGIEIKFTGLRPGEKLYEELLIGDDVDGTEHPKIMKAHEGYIPLTELEKEFKIIQGYLDKYEYNLVHLKLKELVSGFNHTSGIVDFLK